MSKYCILLVAVFLLMIETATAQIKWTQRLTLNEKNIPIGQLLEKIQTQYGIQFAFGLDDVPPNLRISIEVRSETLVQIVNQICLQGNLTYREIGSVIVFTYEKPKLKKPTEVVHKDEVPVVNGSPTSIEPTRDATEITVNSDKQEHALPASPPVVKQVESDTASVAQEKTPTSPTKRALHVGVFINYAKDDNQFHFVSSPTSNHYYSNGDNQALNLGALVKLGTKWNLSIGAGISNKAFHLDYNYQILDPRDPFPIPARTSVTLQYLELPVKVGYQVMQLNKFSFLLTAGSYAVIRIKEGERTSYLNKATQNTRFFLDANQSRGIASSGSIMTHYSITTGWSVYLEPEYVYFFDALNSTAMESRTTSLRLKAGVLWMLNSKRSKPT